MRVPSDGDDCRHLPLDKAISRWGRLPESREFYPHSQRERRRMTAFVCAGVQYSYANTQNTYVVVLIFLIICDQPI